MPRAACTIAILSQALGALALVAISALASLGGVSRAVAETAPPADTSQQGSQGPIDALAQAEPGGADDKPRTEPTRRGKPSEAERVARLERAVEADRQQLDTLKNQDAEHDGEYRAAASEFEKIDRQRSELASQIESFRSTGKAKEADALTAEKDELQARWQTAKDQFDLALQERKALAEKAAALENKLQQDQEALDRLTGRGPARPPVTAGASDAVQPASHSKSEEAARSGATAPVVAAPVNAPAAVASSGDSDKTRAGLARAMKEAQLKEAAAKEYDQRAELVAERFAALRSNIAIEERLLVIARTKTDQALAARGSLDKKLQQAMAEDPGKLSEVWAQIAEADERFRQARAESRATQNRMNDLQNELNNVQNEQLAVLRRAKQMHGEALAAQGEVAKLQNPFTATNLIQWALDHCPKLITILAAAFFLHLLVNLSSRHLTQIVARTVSRGTQHERENRAVTLVAVFRNTASLSILGGGTLMALDEVGIPIMPLMGGAAVLGLAVAFGAQNLVRDYFSGFMVLLEDQYGINDVVKIADISGVVEKITLRMTVLRDLEGIVHFVPHGSITRVSNLTHGWSRAVVEVNISYKENPDYVMSVLIDVANELRRDPVFGPLILDEPEMLGLDRFGDYAVVLKFVLKTHPLKRWPVRRELLLRIKRRFDELGIEIPFPQRTVYNRRENEPRVGDKNRPILGKTA
jgi:moderate conductance mechanosensitive channel